MMVAGYATPTATSFLSIANYTVVNQLRISTETSQIGMTRLIWRHETHLFGTLSLSVWFL
jgi:hypothetical protein